MVNWDNNQKKIIEEFERTGIVHSTRVICMECKHIIDKKNLDDDKCPICGSAILKDMCPLDGMHSCASPQSATIEFCPICGESICPECGSHDVVGMSRVTGYYADVSGWNLGKQQELRDRHRA